MKIVGGKIPIRAILFWLSLSQSYKNKCFIFMMFPTVLIFLWLDIILNLFKVQYSTELLQMPKYTTTTTTYSNNSSWWVSTICQIHSESFTCINWCSQNIGFGILWQINRWDPSPQQCLCSPESGVREREQIK